MPRGFGGGGGAVIAAWAKRNLANRANSRDSIKSFRVSDRRHGVVQPGIVHHTSLLPPARSFPGRIIFVAGSIKALYKSNGTTWTAV